MSEEIFQPQSISVNGSNISGQIGIAGRDLKQTQVNSPITQKPLTSTEVISHLTEIEALIKSASLSEPEKSAVIRHLETGKAEIGRKEPNKNFAAISLQRVIETLKAANETVGLLDKVKPIVEKLTPWFGVAKGFFGL